MSSTAPSAADANVSAGRAEFLDLVQSLDAIVWEMDARTWRFTFVSDRAEHILGYPARRWLEEPTFWQDVLLHPEDRTWAVDFCVAATNEARDHEFLYRARHADGRTVWLKDLVRIVRAADGTARLMRGIMIDVTREKEAEARQEAQVALERERAHLALALEAGQMGTWEWDIAARRVHWSPEEERLYGLPPGSFPGTTDAYMACIHPDDRAEAWRLVEEALQRRDEAHHVLHRIVRPDGAVRWLDSHGRFVYDADGRPLRLVGVSADATDRVHTQRPRERQSEMLAAVEVGAWYCDLPFAELQWDRKVKEHFWLLPDARVTIDTFYERIHPDDRDRTRAAIEHSIGAQAPYDIEYRTVPPAEHPGARTGAVRWVRAIGYTAYDASGRPIRFDGITVDVTAQKRVAEQLSVSEQRYEMAARATSNAIWDWVFATNGVSWNAGVYGLFGYAPGEVEETADWWYEHIHPDDRERVVAGIHTVIDEVGGPVAWRDEYRFRRADGTHAWIVDRGYVTRDASGRATRMIGAMEDVSARREAEEALRHQHYIQDTITNNATAALFMMDADGRCTFMNPAAVAMTGFTLDEIKDVPLHYAIHHHRPDGTLYPMADCPVDRALPENFDVRAHEDTFIRKDGTYFPVLCAASPIFDHGRPVGTVVEVRDVTEQVAAKQRLDELVAAIERQRMQLAELLEQAPASISMTRGPDHVGVMQNALSRQIAGRSTVGRRVRDAFPELEGQGLFELIDRVYGTGEPVAANETFVRWDRDGDGVAEAEGYFNVVWQPIRAADGSVDGVLTHSIEVSAQVRARQEIEAKAEELARLSDALERSNRELDQFAYVTSHDLKAPLRGIANLTQWIEEDLGDRVTGDSREHMRLLKGRVHRMEALIDGILTYSRAARTQAKAEAVDSGALVGEVLDLLAPAPGVVTVQADLPVVQAERVPLQQVLMNLLGNALKHGRADAPRVTVAWRDADPCWEFAVSDNGPGIAAEYHERIWGIFQTLQARDKVEGTGIGLAVVKKIVEARGGRAWVDSAAGAGATFKFTWPKAALP